MTLLLSLSLLAALHWAGAGRTTSWRTTAGPAWIRTTVDWFGQVFGGVAWLLTGPASPDLWGARVACLILVVVTLWAYRRQAFHATAYKPGAVRVDDLVPAVPEDQPQPRIADLTARLRKQLSETELYAPTNLPAVAPTQSFLDLLGDLDAKPQDLMTSLLRLISRLRPKLAYLVGGVLLVRDEEPRFGITVTLTSYVMRGSRAQTFWEPSWNAATCKAGYWVMSALLPITRAGRRQPWRSWYGRDLPLELFAAYQRARELGRQRRFDEVLDCYYRAIRRDPLNAYLRNQIGATQEKLGLHLDALETYYGAMSVGGRGSWEAENRLYAAPWGLRRFTHLWHLRDQPGVLQARYRFAIVLGTAEQTAKQWCKTGPDARGVARGQIREALAPAFAHRYSAIVRDLAAADGQEAFDWLLAVLTLEEGRTADARAGRHGSAAVDIDEAELRKRTVALVFQRASFLEMCKLVEDYPLARLVLRFQRDETALSRAALRVNRDVWAPVRLSHAQEDFGEPAARMLDWAPHGWWMLADRGPQHPWWRRKVERTAKAVAQSQDDAARGLSKALRKALRYSTFSPREWIAPREWQGRYNAAAAYAVASMRHRSARRDTQLAECSCSMLREALRRARGGSMSLMRSWLLYEDPDLAVLRTRPEFARFAREFYPHPTPDILPVATTDRETKQTDVEMTAYDRDFLEAVGNSMERVWHHRGAQAPASFDVVRGWLEQEKRIWQLVDILSASEARNWQNRRRLIEAVERTADPAVRPRIELPSSVPEFDEILTADRETGQWVHPDRVRVLRDGLPSRVDAVLHMVHGCLREGSGHSPIACSTDMLEAMRRFDASGWETLHAVTVTLICSRYAAVWRAFSAQFSPLLADPAAPGLDLGVALDRLGTAPSVVRSA